MAVLSGTVVFSSVQINLSIIQILCLFVSPPLFIISFFPLSVLVPLCFSPAGDREPDGEQDRFHPPAWHPCAYPCPAGGPLPPDLLRQAGLVQWPLRGVPRHRQWPRQVLHLQVHSGQDQCQQVRPSRQERLPGLLWCEPHLWLQAALLPLRLVRRLVQRLSAGEDREGHLARAACSAQQRQQGRRHSPPEEGCTSNSAASPWHLWRSRVWRETQESLEEAMRWRGRSQEEELRRQMAAAEAAARGFPEVIPTAVMFRTGCGETEQRMREKGRRKCEKI